MATFITPVAKTIGASGAWTDIDCSSDIPSGSTGVILRIRNTTVFGQTVGVRKNGSTDTITFNSQANSQRYAVIGVDGSRIFEAITDDDSASAWDVIGYFGSEAVFFTNAVVKSVTPATWQAVSIASDTGGDTAVAALVILNDAFVGGLRQTGSTDNNLVFNPKLLSSPVGCDGSEQFDVYSGDNADVKVVGYMTSGITWNTNANDRSLGSTGSYADLTALASGAIGGIYQCTSADDFALRENGSSEDIYLAGPSHAMVKCDASRLVEGKIEAITQDFWELGYFTAAAAGGNANLLVGKFGALLRGKL